MTKTFISKTFFFLAGIQGHCLQRHDAILVTTEHLHSEQESLKAEVKRMRSDLARLESLEPQAAADRQAAQDLFSILGVTKEQMQTAYARSDAIQRETVQRGATSEAAAARAADVIRTASRNTRNTETQEASANHEQQV